ETGEGVERIFRRLGLAVGLAVLAGIGLRRALLVGGLGLLVLILSVLALLVLQRVVLQGALERGFRTDLAGELVARPDLGLLDLDVGLDAERLDRAARRRVIARRGKAQRAIG